MQDVIVLEHVRQVEDLPYYYPGDECSEMFEQLGNVYYQLCGLACNKRAAHVLGWMKEDSQASADFALDQYGDLNEVYYYKYGKGLTRKVTK